jgi:hypothetical protein
VLNKVDPTSRAIRILEQSLAYFGVPDDVAEAHSVQPVDHPNIEQFLRDEDTDAFEAAHVSLDLAPVLAR